MPNFCKDFPRRTLAGKICITCRRPSEKIIKHFSEGRRQEKKRYLQIFVREKLVDIFSEGRRQEKKLH